MCVIEVQCAQLRRVCSEQLHRLTSRCVGHGIVGLVAVCECGLKSGDEIGLRGLGLLNLRLWVLLVQHFGTEQVLSVGEMSNDLSIRAYRIHGLEAVVLFGHFFSRANQNALLESVDALGERAQWIDRSLLFLSNNGQSKNRKQNCDQKSLHGFLLFDWYAEYQRTRKGVRTYGNARPILPDDVRSSHS